MRASSATQSIPPPMITHGTRQRQRSGSAKPQAAQNFTASDTARPTAGRPISADLGPSERPSGSPPRLKAARCAVSTSQLSAPG